MTSGQHVAVMPDEVLHWLAPRSGQVVVDGTFGAGGHTRLLAQQVGDQGRVIALDRDETAIDMGRKSCADLPATLVHASFHKLPQVLEHVGLDEVDGVVLDLGLSSDQLADRQRGFSYESDGPLDMRFDQTQGEPTWEWLNRVTESELADVIFRFGEERHSRRIARQVVATRRESPIRTARQLADLVRGCVARSKHHRIDPATRTFQALRIFTNDELSRLEQALSTIPSVLSEGARLVIISFHSLEDRLVKHAMREDPRLDVLTKKPVRPGASEVAMNARSRSAKLRAAERVKSGP